MTAQVAPPSPAEPPRSAEAKPPRAPRATATRERREKRLVRAFFFFTFFVYTCVFPYIASFNNPNENVRVYMVMAIVEQHTFRIDKILERHGYVNDMAKAPDPVTKEPHLYSIKAPAVSYLGAPVYWAFTKIAPHFGHPVPTPASPNEERVFWFRATVLVLRLFVVQLPAFFFLVWFERFLRGVSDDVVLRLTSVAAVGLGTNFLAYSLMFVSHTFFGLTTFVSFALILRERERSKGDAKRRRAKIAFLAGLFAGLATLSEYQAFPVSCVLAIYAFTTFWRPTRLLAYLAGAGLNAAALMFYQWRCYANPLTPGHKLAENPQFAAWHQSGFFGLSTPSWDIFRDLSVSHGYGFFGTAPFMWLGLLAVPFGLFASRGVRGTRGTRGQKRLATFMWLFAMLALWLPISAAINWRGGWTLGPRFFGAAPAFFAFGALGAMEHLAGRSRLRRALLRGIAGGLTVAGAVQLGFTSLVFNTFPESVTRPLLQMAVPLAHLGFVPHHVGELLGFTGTGGWYVVVACLFLATLLAVLWPSRDHWVSYAVRAVLVVGFAAIGLRPAVTEPDAVELTDAGVSGEAHVQDLRFFMGTWEPQGRDRLAVLREEAERYGKRGPCLWYRLADLERSADLAEEALRDETRAGGAPRSQCTRATF